MANNYQTLSSEAWEYLLSVIKVQDYKSILDDISVAENRTFSSFKIDALLTALLEDANKYTDELCANLTRLTLSVVNSMDEICESNVMYLIKEGENSSYSQYLYINGAPLFLGLAEVDMSNYVLKTELDAKLAEYSPTVDIKTELDKKLNINQGIENANKILKVNESGDLALTNETVYDDTELRDLIENITDGTTVVAKASDSENATALTVTDLGNISGKTITEFRSILDAWYSNNVYKSAKARFQGEWVSAWNSDDESLTVDNGTTWTVEVVATYNSEYGMFMFSTYSDKKVYFARKSSGTWKNAYTPWEAETLGGKSADEFLSTSGGTIDGRLIINDTSTNDYPNTTHFITFDGYSYIRNFVDDDNYSDLVIDGNTVHYNQRVDGVTNGNVVLHSGNVEDYVGANVDKQTLTVNDWCDANITYRVVNGVAYVTMYITSDTMSTQNQVVPTTLPKSALGGSNWFSLAASADVTTAPIQNLLVKVSDAGEVSTYSGTNGVGYFGTFSYPVAES